MDLDDPRKQYLYVFDMSTPEISGLAGWIIGWMATMDAARSFTAAESVDLDSLRSLQDFIEMPARSEFHERMQQLEQRHRDAKHRVELVSALREAAWETACYFPAQQAAIDMACVWLDTITAEGRIGTLLEHVLAGTVPPSLHGSISIAAKAAGGSEADRETLAKAVGLALIDHYKRLWRIRECEESGQERKES